MCTLNLYHSCCSCTQYSSKYRCKTAFFFLPSRFLVASCNVKWTTGLDKYKEKYRDYVFVSVLNSHIYSSCAEWNSLIWLVRKSILFWSSCAIATKQTIDSSLFNYWLTFIHVCTSLYNYISKCKMCQGAKCAFLRVTASLYIL